MAGDIGSNNRIEGDGNFFYQHIGGVNLGSLDAAGLADEWALAGKVKREARTERLTQAGEAFAAALVLMALGAYLLWRTGGLDSASAMLEAVQDVSVELIGGGLAAAISLFCAALGFGKLQTSEAEREAEQHQLHADNVARYKTDRRNWKRLKKEAKLARHRRD
ncbi:hypothetical protein CGLAUT_11630 [Corynebacterium glaucum]|uniref:hypothetical protein n=1 Tax=Corynebacterium glaucum TaxID=187491 RepID=UPI0025B2AF65|nr:hypothetical protein [Corynebacterium glaucum]WJZ08781.1 hypothetical protein CGLAUT_11630 [Corynebacterium glaucum]